MDTEQKHSPGPWYAGNTFPCYQTGIAENGSPDARLEAAPDLLTALKALLRECKYQAEIGNMPDDRVEFTVAEAAIAKAEGKQPSE